MAWYPESCNVLILLGSRGVGIFFLILGTIIPVTVSTRTSNYDVSCNKNSVEAAASTRNSFIQIETFETGQVVGLPEARWLFRRIAAHVVYESSLINMPTPVDQVVENRHFSRLMDCKGTGVSTASRIQFSEYGPIFIVRSLALTIILFTAHHSHARLYFCHKRGSPWVGGGE